MDRYRQKSGSMYKVLFWAIMSFGFTYCNGQARYSYSLRDDVNKLMDSINAITNLYINNPTNEKDYIVNDSLTESITGLTDRVLETISNAYGKVPTDSIFEVLHLLDDTGFIPADLLNKLTDYDFSTLLGQSAKQAFVAYNKKVKKSEDYLSTVDLCIDTIFLYDIAHKDTVRLCELLKRQPKYKILDLWSAWCAPCRSFNMRYQKNYATNRNKGIAILGIGVNVETDGINKFLAAVKHDNTPWPQFIDINNSIYKTLKADGTPFQVLLNDQNKIIRHFSYDMEHDLKEMFSF